MGLDMFAWSIDASEWDAEKNRIHPETDKFELFYWRKHHDLHGWMEKLFRSRGGVGDFNCDQVLLSREDLKALAKDVKANRLPQTTGFFFGNNPPDKDSQNRDLRFIELAIRELDKGKLVVYDSWW